MAEVKVDFLETMETAFTQYAGAVLLERALPDARDGLKLGARQGLYAQFSSNLTYDKPIKKMQKSVSAGMAQSYCHGDTSLYNTLMRMGKPFAVRYLLQDIQGSVGDLVKRDNHAASRYVEGRLSKLGGLLFEGIKKNAIARWVDNYDDTEKIPSVLPSPFFYNIINGSLGIGVGLATSIPCFNLTEVNAAFVKLIKDPNATFEELYCPIDFPTGGSIINESQVKESLKEGRGKSALIRATIEYNPKKHQLVVTEVPYMVYTETICEQLAVLMEEDPTIGIDKVLDGTSIHGPFIEIGLKKNSNPEKIKSWLYANTSLQTHYGINMTMLDEGKVPRIFGWREALVAHLNHAYECKRREKEFDLNKLQARLHVVEGLLIAIAHIDEFIAIIKKSNGPSAACSVIEEKFGLSNAQAKAILDIRLARLTNLEYVKIEDEKKSLISQISELEELLTNQEKFDIMMIEGFNDVAKEFGDARRSKNLDIAEEVDGNIVKEITKADGPVHLFISARNQLYVATEEEMERRKGRPPLNLSSKDRVIKKIWAKRDGYLLGITKDGKVYTTPLGKINTSISMDINTIFSISVFDELILVEYIEPSAPGTLVSITSNGQIKQTRIKEYISRIARPSEIMKYKNEEDQFVTAFYSTNPTQEIAVITENGFVARYNLSDIPTAGKATLGVIGVKLSPKDKVVDIQPVEGKYLSVVLSDGKIKTTPWTELIAGIRPLKGNMLLKGTAEAILKGVTHQENQNLILITKSTSLDIPFAKLVPNERGKAGRKILDFTGNISVLYFGGIE